MPNSGASRVADRNRSNGNIRSQFFMVVQHFLEIHLVKLIAGKDQHIFTFKWKNMPKALTHGIGGALEPGGIVRCLFRCEDIDKRRAEGTEMIGVLDMPVERGGIELRQHKHPVDA